MSFDLSIVNVVMWSLLILIGVGFAGVIVLSQDMGKDYDETDWRNR